MNNFLTLSAAIPIYCVYLYSSFHSFIFVFGTYLRNLIYAMLIIFMIFNIYCSESCWMLPGTQRHLQLDLVSQYCWVLFSVWFSLVLVQEMIHWMRISILTLVPLRWCWLIQCLGLHNQSCLPSHLRGRCSWERSLQAHVRHIKYPHPLCYIVLYSTLLCSTVLYSTLLYCTLLYSLLYSIALYRTLLYCTALHCAPL